MRLERASAKAVKFAIMNWHYSKTLPVVQCAYAVFNDAGDWCGVICYSIGASNNIASPFGLSGGQVIELVRVALNGKQKSTSKAIAISLMLLKKENPLVMLVVSYADSGQNHVGVIYQASNWYFVSSIKTPDSYIKNGQKIHSRNVSSSGKKKQFGVMKLVFKPCEMDEIVPGTVKHKYVYPLDKSMVPMCKAMSKPYPKKEVPQPAAVV